MCTPFFNSFIISNNVVLLIERYFTTNEWRFASGQVNDMLKAAKVTGELVDFNIDIRSMNWDVYVKRFVLGTQQYILKSGEESLPSARRTLKMYTAC